jgi:hypothetical protein
LNEDEIPTRMKVVCADTLLREDGHRAVLFFPCSVESALVEKELKSHDSSPKGEAMLGGGREGCLA